MLFLQAGYLNIGEGQRKLNAGFPSGRVQDARSVAPWCGLDCFDCEVKIKIVDSHCGDSWQKGLVQASVSQKFSEGKTFAAADIAQIFHDEGGSRESWSLTIEFGKRA